MYLNIIINNWVLLYITTITLFKKKQEKETTITIMIIISVALN